MSFLPFVFRLKGKNNPRIGFLMSGAEDKFSCDVRCTYFFEGFVRKNCAGKQWAEMSKFVIFTLRLVSLFSFYLD